MEQRPHSGGLTQCSPHASSLQFLPVIYRICFCKPPHFFNSKLLEWNICSYSIKSVLCFLRHKKVNVSLLK